MQMSSEVMKLKNSSLFIAMLVSQIPIAFISHIASHKVSILRLSKHSPFDVRGWRVEAKKI